MSNQPPELDPLPEHGTLIPVAKFVSAVRSRGFIDYDGFGHWATATGVSPLVVRPSTLGDPPSWATHVLWYNR